MPNSELEQSKSDGIRPSLILIGSNWATQSEFDSG